MKKYGSLFALVLFALSFSGCGLHSGLIFNSASLQEGNFRYIERDIYGSATTLQVFGIGGLKRQAIAREAQEKMMLGRELQANQALANLTISYKRAFYFFVITTKCTVSADIVEFEEED